MKIHADVLKYLPKCASKENSRYSLGSILLEQEGDDCRAIATDAKILCQVSWKSDVNGLTSGTLLPAKASADLAKLGTSKSPKLLLTDEGEAFALAGSADLLKTSTVKKAEGRFPKWQDVLPAGYSSRPSVSLAVDCLRRALDGVSGSTGADNVEIYFPTGEEKNKPLVIESRYRGGESSYQDRQALAVIMPLMNDEKAKEARSPDPRPWKARLTKASPEHFIRRNLIDLAEFPTVWIRWENGLGYDGDVHGMSYFECKSDKYVEFLTFIVKYDIDGEPITCTLSLPWDEFEASYGAPTVEAHQGVVLTDEILRDLASRAPFEGLIEWRDE